MTLINSKRAPGRTARFLLFMSLIVILVACATAEPVEEEIVQATITSVPALEVDYAGPRLPAPTGPYAVGRWSSYGVDDDREEVHTLDREDRRQLLLEVWYPAEYDAAAQPAPYMAAAIAEAYDFPQEANAFFSYAVHNAPVLSAQEQYPVIIFSTGFTAIHTGYTALLEELASHGYVVATTSRPYIDSYALLSDGMVVEYIGDLAFGELWLPEDPFVSELYDVAVPDTLFAIQMLNEANEDFFVEQLDLAQIGFVGHSFGGAIAGEVCRLLDARCAGAINFDGNQSRALEEQGMAVPYMFMAAEGTNSAQSARVQAAMDAVSADGYVLEIAGATHFGFGDGYYFSDVRGTLDNNPGLYGEIEPDQLLIIVRDYTRAFFDRHLRGEAASLLENGSDTDDVTLDTYLAD